ncbi:hypothetical protein TYRP_010985, partial [Tyrophagus putrescentiae]
CFALSCRIWQDDISLSSSNTPLSLVSSTPPSIMPPQHVTDLSLIAVFNEFTLNDQLSASKVCPRWTNLMRVANLRVRSLIISGRSPEGIESIKHDINSFSLTAHAPSMQMLPDCEPQDCPMITHLSKWNCLLLNYKEKLTSLDVEQIVTIFPAITDLKLDALDYEYEYIQHFGFNCIPVVSPSENMMNLLKHPNWASQLIKLMVIPYSMYSGFKIETNSRLITTINSLPALQNLSIQNFNIGESPDFSILAQLKEFSFQSKQHYTEEAIYIREPSKIEELFSAYAQLKQLVHLNLTVNSEGFNENSPENLPHRPMTPLPSVRALDLRLTFTSHSHVKWLNLQKTLPNLQVIFLKSYWCENCKVHSQNYLHGNYNESSTTSFSKAYGCFSEILFNLHPGVPLKQIFFEFPFSGEYISLEQFLLSN